MSQWLQRFAYRVSLSGWTFLLAGCIAVALLTISFKAVGAARANPAFSLRTE
jgi:putative ABC transport system permease protein